MDIACTQSDLDYYKAEFERKVQVIDEMQKIIDAKTAKVQEAESVAARMSVDLLAANGGIRDLLKQIDGLRARLAQSPHNFHAENVESLVQIEAPDLLKFVKAVEDGLYGDAVNLMPKALRKQIEAIPADRKIERIKVFRQAMRGLGRKEAKDFIDIFSVREWECPF
jgi:hypothetical protein